MKSSVLIDFTFPDENISRRFVEQCRDSIVITHAISGCKVYLVLKRLEDRVRILREIEKYYAETLQTPGNDHGDIQAQI